MHEAPMHGWHRDFAPREGVVGGGMQRRSKGGRQVAGGQESAVVSMCMLIGKLCMLIGIGKLCMGDVSTGTRAFRGTHTWLHGEGGTQAYTIQSVVVSRPETARRECVRAELWPVRARAMGPVCDEVASAGGGTKAGRGWMFELRRVVHATVLYLGNACIIWGMGCGWTFHVVLRVVPRLYHFHSRLTLSKVLRDRCSRTA